MRDGGTLKIYNNQPPLASLQIICFILCSRQEQHRRDQAGGERDLGAGAGGGPRPSHRLEPVHLRGDNKQIRANHYLLSTSFVFVMFAGDNILFPTILVIAQFWWKIFCSHSLLKMVTTDFDSCPSFKGKPLYSP